MRGKHTRPFIPFTSGGSETSPSTKSPAIRRKSKTQMNPVDRDRTPIGPRISRSSSSPLIHHGGQVSLNRLPQMSTVSEFEASSGIPLKKATRNAHSHTHLASSRPSMSHQHLSVIHHSPFSQLPPVPDQRHSSAQPNPHFHSASSYSGSDADDDNETLDERPLLLRSRSSGGNVGSRRVNSHPNLTSPLSPVTNPLAMARKDARTDGETVPVRHHLRLFLHWLIGPFAHS